MNTQNQHGAWNQYPQQQPGHDQPQPHYEQQPPYGQQYPQQPKQHPQQYPQQPQQYPAQGEYGSDQHSGYANEHGQPHQGPGDSRVDTVRPWHPERRKHVAVPTKGWRRLAYRATGGAWNPGLPKKERRRAELLAAIDQPVRTHRIAVSCLKGGVGKTTTSVAVGTVYAKYRRDLTTAIDANPDRGTLSQRLGPEHALTVRDLIDNVGEITSADALRRFTHQARSRLEVLASDRDPEKARAFSPDDYRLVQEILQTFRQIIITDTGTDLTNPVIDAVIESTDTLVVPASTAQDGADLAWETLDTWESRGEHGAFLVRNAVVAITQHSDGPQVPLEALRTEFAKRVRAVVLIPHDRHLAGGGEFDWDLLDPRTQDAEIEVAAAVAADFVRSGYAWT